MPQPITLERFAELTARMACGGKRSDVLQAAGLDEETWEMSEQYWLGKMATEAARDRYSLAQRYGVLYKTAQARVLGLPMKLQRYKPRSKQVIVQAIPGVPTAPSASAAMVAASVPTPASTAAPSARPPALGGSYTARLTLEQLAAMRAEVALAPDADQPGVVQRFGLDASTWEQEEAHWQRKLAGDPDLFKRYLKQFQYCRSLLQRG